MRRKRQKACIGEEVWVVEGYSAAPGEVTRIGYENDFRGVTYVEYWIDTEWKTHEVPEADFDKTVFRTKRAALKRIMLTLKKGQAVE